MSAQHTPGDWVAEHGAIRTADGSRWLFESASLGWQITNEERHANARLIAAAPDMLAVVSELLERGEASLSLLNKARAAIAKAEGV